MAFCSLLTVLVLSHITGGLHGAEVESSIVGGRDAPEGKWPWMVHLNISDGKSNRWRCGGTLLNSRWVLTAASCWDKNLKPKNDRSMAWIGAYKLHKRAESYRKIISVVLNFDYRAVGNGFVDDIALVKLDKDIKFSNAVAPVSLPSVDSVFGPSSQCWITGWGDIKTGVPLPNPETLQQAQVSIVKNNVCKLTYPELTSNMMCAGDMAGGKGACKGDNGDPLVCFTGSGYVQVGIMSYGSPKGCALSGYPGVFTQVSKYLRFINDYTRQA